MAPYNTFFTEVKPCLFITLSISCILVKLVNFFLAQVMNLDDQWASAGLKTWMLGVLRLSYDLLEYHQIHGQEFSRSGKNPSQDSNGRVARWNYWNWRKSLSTWLFVTKRYIPIRWWIQGGPRDQKGDLGSCKEGSFNLLWWSWLKSSANEA